MFEFSYVNCPYDTEWCIFSEYNSAGRHFNQNTKKKKNSQVLDETKGLNFQNIKKNQESKVTLKVQVQSTPRLQHQNILTRKPFVILENSCPFNCDCCYK